MFFYLMWKPGGIIFYKSLLLLWSFFFSSHVLPFFEVSSWKEVQILFFCLHSTSNKAKVQCKRQSSKMKLSYNILIKFVNYFCFLMHNIFLSIKKCYRKSYNLYGRMLSLTQMIENNYYTNVIKSVTSHQNQNITD